MDRELIIRKLLGKPEFKLSSEVPNSYLLGKGLSFFLNRIHGFFSKVGIANCGKNFMVGMNSKILVKRKVSIGNNVRIDNYVYIDALSTKGVYLGDRVKIGSYSKLMCTGSLSHLGVGISIGNDSSFSENTFFGAAGGISIGDNVISGQSVRFHAENHNFSDGEQLIRLQGVNHQGIKVGNNVWIGSGVVFLDGSSVGSGCIVGAGAVVTGNFSDNTIIAGIPAKKIGER